MSKKLFLFLFAANVALALVSWAILPERVAIHFGASGWPDNWASGRVNALAFIGLHLVLWLAIYGSQGLIFIFPARFVNLPNKDYWLAPANRERTQQILSGLMYRFGVAIFAFFFAIGLLALQANRSDPVRLNLPVFFLCLGLFMLYTVAWVVAFFRCLRRPAPGAA